MAKKQGPPFDPAQLLALRNKKKHHAPQATGQMPPALKAALMRRMQAKASFGPHERATVDSSTKGQGRK